jgi:hypothetical protein
MALRSAITEAGLIARVRHMLGCPASGIYPEVDAAIEDAIRCGYDNAWDIRHHAERLLGYRSHA